MLEFQWCQVQYGRVVYVNGAWTGKDDKHMAEDYGSCPHVWQYLDERGREGWDVASSHGYEVVAGDAHDAIQVVVLRRARK